MAGWQRIEAMARSIDLEGGLQARIADPLWMLARQWQVGSSGGTTRRSRPPYGRSGGRSQ
jgi:hypothetical protein